MSVSALRAAAHVAGIIEMSDVERIPDSDASPTERVAAFKAEHPELFFVDVRSMSAKDFQAARTRMLQNGNQVHRAASLERQAAEIQQREQQRHAQAEIDRAAREKHNRQRAQVERIQAEMRRGRHARSA